MKKLISTIFKCRVFDVDEKNCYAELLDVTRDIDLKRDDLEQAEIPLTKFPKEHRIFIEHHWSFFWIIYNDGSNSFQIIEPIKITDEQIEEAIEKAKEFYALLDQDDDVKTPDVK